MDPGSLVAVITTSATVLVTVLLFTIDAARRERSARREARRLLVSDVLSAMDRAARELRKPAIFRPWSRPETEFVLLAPRLLLNLQPKELPVGYWATSQTQRMIAATSDKSAFKEGIGIATKLTEWHQGLRPLDWFVQELAAQPVVAAHAPSLRAQLRRTASRTGDMVVGAVFVGLAIGAAKAALEQ